MSNVTLTDAERETLDGGTSLFGWAIHDEALAHLVPVVESLVAARVAEALRDAAENVFMDETLEGRTAMVRTNDAWRLLLNHLADEFDPEGYHHE